MREPGRRREAASGGAATRVGPPGRAPGALPARGDFHRRPIPARDSGRTRIRGDGGAPDRTRGRGGMTDEPRVHPAGSAGRPGDPRPSRSSPCSSSARRDCGWSSSPATTRRRRSSPIASREARRPAVEGVETGARTAFLGAPRDGSGHGRRLARRGPSPRLFALTVTVRWGRRTLVLASLRAVAEAPEPCGRARCEGAPSAGFTLSKCSSRSASWPRLLAIAFGGLRVGLAAWRGATRARRASTTRGGWPVLLERALGGAYPVSDRARGEREARILFDGLPDRLTFATLSPPSRTGRRWPSPRSACPPSGGAGAAPADPAQPDRAGTAPPVLVDARTTPRSASATSAGSRKPGGTLGRPDGGGPAARRRDHPGHPRRRAGVPQMLTVIPIRAAAP